MKPLRDWEEVEEVELEETSEEEEPGEEDQVDATTVMRKATWLDIFLILRWPWCSHCRTNGHATEDCPELIAKWEDRVCQQGNNLISSEIKRVIKGKLPNLNIVTRGGEKTGADADNFPQIQKEVPKEDMYDPLKHKLFFKNSIEVFQNIPGPEMQEKPHQPIIYPRIVQVPASPPAPRNL
jgi:hypothetical protein